MSNQHPAAESGFLPEILKKELRPSILLISKNKEISATIHTAISNLNVILFFSETRGSSIEFLTGNRDINLILFDITDSNDIINTLDISEAENYFSFNSIPVMLIISKEQTENVLDLFSENIIDFWIFPISISDFLARIKLHLSVLVANKELKNLTLQLHTILEGTKNIAKTRDPLTATTVACSFILRLTGVNDAALHTIYLPGSSFQKESYFSAHRPIEGFNLLTKPSEKEVRQVDGINLTDIKEPIFHNGNLYIPVINETDILSILKFNNIPENHTKSKNYEYILSIVNSLSIVLRNFRHEDHSRLAHIGQMAAAIIHDLKNYTVVIRNSAKLALNDSLSSGEKFQFLNNISYESERMLEMTHDILDFSRGEISIKLSRINSENFKNRLKQFLSPLCHEREVSLEILNNYNGNLSIDMERILRAIFNIALNACDAMSEKPPVDRSFTLNIDKKGAILILELTDRGSGIPLDLQNKIFEPFISGKKQKGTGLGMAIARSIVVAHGGTIDFKTQKNSGTTFTIQIPQRIQEREE